MRKLLLFGATLAAAPVFAATTGSISISGTVPAATAIVVTGDTGYNALDLATTATDLAVANVQEVNNTTAGYVVSLSSVNAGKLKNGALGNVTYTAKYNGSAVTLSATPVTVTTGAASNSVVNVTKVLKVSYTGTPAAGLMVGNYSDTLTFTITAN